jgi:hypothetical protein
MLSEAICKLCKSLDDKDHPRMIGTDGAAQMIGRPPILGGAPTVFSVGQGVF